jgi:hypothetical protein
MGWMTGVQFPAGAVIGFFLLAIAYILALGPIQPPIKWVLGAFSPGIKQLVCEADNSPPSCAEVKNAWSYTSTPPINFNGMVFNEARNISSWCDA